MIWTVTLGSASAAPANRASGPRSGHRVEDMGDRLPARIEAATCLRGVGVAVTEGDNDPAASAFCDEIECTGQFGSEGHHRDRTGVSRDSGARDPVLRGARQGAFRPAGERGRDPRGGCRECVPRPALAWPGRLCARLRSSCGLISLLISVGWKARTPSRASALRDGGELLYRGAEHVDARVAVHLQVDEPWDGDPAVARRQAERDNVAVLEATSPGTSRPCWRKAATPRRR